MKAIVFERAGEPADVLKLAETPYPAMGTADLRVRVSARPIHPADLAFVRGQYRIRPTFPQVAGLEGTGTVLDSPVGATIRPGARVAFRAPGSWGEVASVPLASAIEVPADMPDATACQISLNPMTAIGLLSEAGARPGDWIILTAAASSVCNLVGAIARKRDLGVIGLVRGDATNAMVRCTADRVLSADDPRLPEQVLALTGDQRSTALLDSVGGPLIPKLFPCLAPGGRVVAYGVLERAPALVTNAALIYGNLTWKGFGIDRWLSGLAQADKAVLHDELWAMVRDGTLALPVAASYPLASIQEAVQADARSGRRGKIVLI